MWCVIECGFKGEILKYIMDDSEECYAMYSDLLDVQTNYNDNEFEAQVWTESI